MHQRQKTPKKTHGNTAFCGGIISAGLLGLVTFFAPDPAAAIGVGPDTSGTAPAFLIDEIDERILRDIRSNSDRFTLRVITQLYLLDRDGVVTQELVNRHRRARFADLRGQAMATLLALDIDDDLQITQEDIAIAMMGRDQNWQAQTRKNTFDADLDDNGIISIEEIQEYGNRHANLNIDQASRRNSGVNPMMFDMNADGRVDPAEVNAAIAAIKEGRLTAAQRPPLPTTPAAPRPLAVLTGCTAPKAAADTEVVVITGYEGAAVSSVAVSGLDTPTSVAFLTIEEGTTPLYIFATAYDSIIWKVDGAVDRVQNFVAQPNTDRTGPGVGVVGLPAEKVTFVSARTCWLKYNELTLSGEGASAKARLAAHLEHAIDKSIYAYQITRLGVTSWSNINSRPLQRETLEKIRDNEESDQVVSFSDSRTAASLLRFYPGGAVQIDVNAVLSSSNVIPYDVYPQHAGLLQLISDGAVEFVNGRYHVISEIARFPAGLSGGHSVTFVLAPGVPVPDGSAGHSSVFMEETGECIHGRGCPRQ